MNITRYDEQESVKDAIEKNEPLMAVISFDSKEAYVSHLDVGVEHHILLRKVGYTGTEIDRFFWIIFDKDGADWTFICPQDYKNIPYKDRRIKAFYRDGISAISEFLSEMGYFCDIKIPKRYKRHFDMMLEDE